MRPASAITQLYATPILNPLKGITTNIHRSYDPAEVDEEALAILRYISPVRQIWLVLTSSSAIYGIQDHILPDKVASVMLFLSSDLSKEVNGAVIPVGNALT